MRGISIALLRLISYSLVVVVAIISIGSSGECSVLAKRFNEISEASLGSSNEPLGPEQTMHQTSIVERGGFRHHKNNEIIDPSELEQNQNHQKHQIQEQQLIALFKLSPADQALFMSIPRDQLKKLFMASMAKNGGFRRGFLTSARTVEPPAISVDSGGVSRVSSRLANSIAKVFNVKQGYYSDIYTQLDRHEPLSNIVKQPKELAVDKSGQIKRHPGGKKGDVQHQHY